MSQLPEEPIYGNEDWQQMLDEEQRRAEEETRHQAILDWYRAQIRGRARGFGPGNTYEYHGPETMGPDGNFHREQRLK